MSPYPIREGYAGTSGGRIFYRVAGIAGDLPDLVLEAGGLCTLRIWSVIENILAPHLRVISYDRAGLGRSPDDGGGCGVDAVLPRFERVLAAAEVRKPFVAGGYSLGGPYLRCYAARHPQDVAGLVLVDATPDRYEVPAATQRKAMLTVKLLHWAVRLGLGKLLLLLEGRKATSELRGQVEELGAPGFLRAAQAEVDAIAGIVETTRTRAAKPMHPTLAILAGIKPRQMSDAQWADVQAQHRDLHARAPQPLSRLEVIATANHGQLCSHPVHGPMIASMILDFVRSLPSRSSS